MINLDGLFACGELLLSKMDKKRPRRMTFTVPMHLLEAIKTALVAEHEEDQRPDVALEVMAERIYVRIENFLSVEYILGIDNELSMKATYDDTP